MYKVGDTVVVRPDIYDGEEYEGVCVVYEMEEYHSMEAIITNIDRRCYRIDLDGGEWCWTASMFCGTKEEYENRNNWNKPFTVDMLDSLQKDRQVCVSVQSKLDADILFQALVEHGYRVDLSFADWDLYTVDTVYWLTSHTVDHSNIQAAKVADFDYIIKYTFHSVALDDIDIPESSDILF